MKKLFFSIGLTATLAVGGFLAYSIWKAAPVTAQEYFESGKKYYGEKKYPEATVQLLNAIRQDARHREARYLLALSFLGQQDLVRAATQLRSLLEYYPDDVPANLELGRIYLAGGRSTPELFRRAQEIAQKVLEKNPENVDALILSGNASAGLQDYRTSVDLFQKALALDPQNFSAYLSLGTTQARQKNYPDAEQAFLKARQINSKDKGVLISLANYYSALQQKDKSEAVFKEALAQYSDDKSVYVEVVDFYIRNDRLPDAEKLLRDVQAKNTLNPEPSLILADLYSSKDRRMDARKLLLDVKEKFPKNVDVAVKLALNFWLDQPERARAEVDRVLKLDPQNPIGPVLLGQVQFLVGQYDAAEATLGKAPAVDSPYPEVHFFLGNIEVGKGQLDQAIFHYQKSLAVNGAYIPSRVALAEAFFNKRRVEDARQEIQKALDTKPDYAPALLLKATIDSADKNNKNAEEEFARLAKDQPQNAMISRQMGLYYESRGKAADAEKSFVRALELQPDSQLLFRDLMLFYIRHKQTGRAIEKINAVADDKKHASHYELLGLAYAESGKMQDAETAYKKALEKDPARSDSDMYLFDQYMKSGRTDDGFKVLDDFIKKNPQDTVAYGTKGFALQDNGKLEEAKRNYEQALKLNPNFEEAANNLAYLLTEQGTDLTTALGYAQTARKRQPENPNFADTLGWVYYKLGNYTLAQEQFRFAISKKPNDGTLQYHLALTYKQMKRTSDAEAALKKAIISPNDFKEKSLAQAALREITSAK
jgi:tetratricopeptide (TPR) repeat protein